MRAKGRIVRRFVVTESRVAHEFESQFFRHVMQHAFVERTDSADKLLYKPFELQGRLFVLILVRMVPFAVVVFGKGGKLIEHYFVVHILLLII